MRDFVKLPTVYVATVNVPGYLPEGDPMSAETPEECWAWLASERRRDLDHMDTADAVRADQGEAEQMDAMSEGEYPGDWQGERAGTVNALGSVGERVLSYTVSIVRHTCSGPYLTRDCQACAYIEDWED